MKIVMDATERPNLVWFFTVDGSTVVSAKPDWVRALWNYINQNTHYTHDAELTAKGWPKIP